jgi:large subunit ribosomal protein L17
MRHRVRGRKLSRTASHRHALLRSLATSLLKHKNITTTTAKAKELRKFVEPIITKAKTDSVSTRRYVSDKINDREVVQDLFGDIITKIGDRPGGYTRIVHRGRRKGDGAELAIIELVDFSGVIKAKTPKKEKGEDKTPDVKEEVKADEKKETKTKKKSVAKPKKEKSSKEKVAVKEKKVKTTKTPQKKGS